MKKIAPSSDEVLSLLMMTISEALAEAKEKIGDFVWRETKVIGRRARQQKIHTLW